MLHDNTLSIGPILDDKKLDIKMARPFSGDTVVDHIDSRHVIESRHVVFVEQSRTVLGVSDFQKDSMKIFCMLCSGGKKLGFHTGPSSSGLSFTTI